MSVHAWLHRKGAARMINASSQSWTDRGGAYVQGCGPRWLAARLAMYALRHSTICRPDWQTIRIVKTQQVGRFRFRFQVTYRRL